MGVALLDTTVLIDLLRGRPGATDRLRRMRAVGDMPYVRAIGVDEVVRGLRPSETSAAKRLFGGLRMVPLGEHEGWRAGAWRRDFAAQGLTLGQADCLVAAAALACGGRLCTGNPKDFPMEGIAWSTGLPVSNPAG